MKVKKKYVKALDCLKDFINWCKQHNLNCNEESLKMYYSPRQEPLYKKGDFVLVKYDDGSKKIEQIVSIEFWSPIDCEILEPFYIYKYDGCSYEHFVVEKIANIKKYRSFCKKNCLNMFRMDSYNLFTGKSVLGNDEE